MVDIQDTEEAMEVIQDMVEASEEVKVHVSPLKTHFCRKGFTKKLKFSAYANAQSVSASFGPFSFSASNANSAANSFGFGR